MYMNEITKLDNKLENIIWLSENLGWNIIPIKIVKKEKIPLIKWKKFQKERITLGQYNEWFGEGGLFQGASIAVITGRISDIIVIDIDPRHDGSKIDYDKSRIITVSVNSGGGGWHFYHQYEEGIKSADFKNGMELKSDGALAVLPPSIHASGKSYGWRMSPQAGTQITPVPEFIKVLVNTKIQTQSHFDPKIIFGSAEGTRNNDCVSLIGKWIQPLPEKDFGMAWDMIQMWNERNNPPLSPKELKEKFTGVVKAELSSRKDEEYSGTELGVYTPPTIKPKNIPDEIEKDDLLEILGRTIKKDNVNKLAVFLAEILAYTEDSQFNISFNAPSSSGKSYIPIEIATLFPQEDIIDLSYASPTSFFHSQSKLDSKRKVQIVDLQRKILIFLDMPHPDLLTRLRSLLSHDKKIIKVKITDKTSKSGTRAKDIEIIGFPSVIFCSASFNFDEQELTRLLLLSPETSQDKLREAINQKAKYLTNPAEYVTNLNSDIKRNELKDRIHFIKHANIQYINLHDEEKLLERFLKKYESLKPRHTRDIGRIASIAKAFALLNLWHRAYSEATGTIITNDRDYENAFILWDEVAQAQDLGLSPYLLNFYNEIIVGAYRDKGSVAITKQELVKKHFEVTGRHIRDWVLRKDTLPTLESSGIISQEPDKEDRRRILITPTLFLKE